MSVKTKEQSKRQSLKARSYFSEQSTLLTFKHLERLFEVFHHLMFFIQSTPLRSFVALLIPVKPEAK